METAASWDCAVCGAAIGSSIVDRIRRVDLERAYREAVNPNVEYPASWGASDDMVVCVECETCGVASFPEEPPGDAAFYASVSSAYPVDYRFEWNVAERLVQPKDTVLDLGSGPGHFLRRLEGRVARRVAAESNPVALEKLQQSAINTYDIDLSDRNAVHDLISAESPTAIMLFQVLEHVAHPTPLIETIALAGSPAAKVIISVPNSSRTPLATTEPLDWPPHHMTRWTEESLARCLTNAGLVVDEVRVERFGSRRRATQPALGPIISTAGLYYEVRYGRKLRWPHGHSLVALAECR